MNPELKKIAIVGTGIAGLTAAHRLHGGNEITVYEADTRIGGHTNTIRVDDPRGERWIDTGFIVHNNRNYPLLTALFDELGVATQPAEMGMSIATADGSFEFANTARGLFAQRSNLLRPHFWRLIADQLRFNREARPLIGRLDGPTVGEFLRDSGYSKWFIERAIAPEIAAVWSADPGAIWNFPLAYLAEFLDNHGQLQLRDRPQWKTVSGGSREYVKALIAPLRERIVTGARVEEIERIAEGVAVRVTGRDTKVFDEVVVAAHADQALAMLAEPTADERRILGALPYRANQAVLHTDASLMPKRRRAWSSWNFHLAEPDDGGSQVTYWMNNLQLLDAERDYFVTLNRRAKIGPDKELAVIDYSHPQITQEGHAAQRRWHEISGVDRVHFCGAYWRWGFHEDGCWSATRVCDQIAAMAKVPQRRLAPAALGELELAA